MDGRTAFEDVERRYLMHFDKFRQKTTEVRLPPFLAWFRYTRCSSESTIGSCAAQTRRRLPDVKPMREGVDSRESPTDCHGSNPSMRRSNPVVLAALNLGGGKGKIHRNPCRVSKYGAPRTWCKLPVTGHKCCLTSLGFSMLFQSQSMVNGFFSGGEKREDGESPDSREERGQPPEDEPSEQSHYRALLSLPAA